MERKPWFKPKQFGYGWTPATWQGWALTLSVLILPLAGVVWLVSRHLPH